MKNIVINVHQSRALSHMVQEFLLEHGYNWVTNFDRNAPLRNYTGVDVAISGNEKGLLSYSPYGYYVRGNSFLGYRFFDAATQMGELIAMLEREEKLVADVTDSGEGAIVSQDGQSVKVGCRTVTFGKVKEIYEAMVAAAKES